jgi:hypothetical protein
MKWLVLAVLFDVCHLLADGVGFCESVAAGKWSLYSFDERDGGWRTSVFFSKTCYPATSGEHCEASFCSTKCAWWCIEPVDVPTQAAWLQRDWDSIAAAPLEPDDQAGR